MKRQWKWRAICDVCGFKYWSDELQKRWDGLMVCRLDYELRHPSDYIKVPKDSPPIPWSRPEQTDVFIEPTYVASTVGTQGGSVPEGNFTDNNDFICDDEGGFGYADAAEADCSVAV